MGKYKCMKCEGKNVIKHGLFCNKKLKYVLIKVKIANTMEREQLMSDLNQGLFDFKIIEEK